MTTGQASFDDASDDVTFNDVDSGDDSPDDQDWVDPDDQDWVDPDDTPEDTPDDAPNGFAETSKNLTGKSKKLDTGISHLSFNGMISNGPNVSNITVTISSGSMSNNYPVVGKSIYEVEKMLGQVLNVNPYARIVLVNGEEVTNDYIIIEGDVIEFVNEAYDKGC
jgi:hypothetical protein